MKTTLLGVLLTAFNAALFAQIDPDATEKTKILYANLKKIQNSPGFLFGQEFFNSFRYSSGAAHGDEEYSDSHAVTGAHPAVLGSDFHYYLEKNDTERGYHTDAVKWAFQQGYVITFDWHISGRNTTTYEYNPTSANLVNNIVNNAGDDRAWFYGELDKVIDIINNDLVVGEDNIPIVFRPFHEMNGGWFWWGSSATSAANYKTFYQMVVDYVKERTNSVLFCWSPNTPVNMSYYPGDGYVDVLGVDAYEINAQNLRMDLSLIVDYAEASGKVSVVSETGNRTNAGANPGDNASQYWSDTVLPAILEDPAGKARKIAWVLTWINASWSYPYVPHPTSSAIAKESFIEFKESGYVYFGGEIETVYEPLPEFTVSLEELVDPVNSIDVYATSDNRLTIAFSEGDESSEIVISDLMGRSIVQMKAGFETTVNMQPGLYVMIVHHGTIRVTKKFVIKRPVTSVVIEIK